MNKILLLAVVVLPSIAFGQKAELGITGGICSNSAPSSSNIYYLADKSATNYAGSLTMVSNLNDHYQFGGDLYVLQLANTSSKTYRNPYGATGTIGNDGKKFQYAQFCISLCPVFNYKYTVSDNVYVYGGIAAGFAFTHTTSNSNDPNYAPNLGFRGIDGGLGYTAGGQIGVSYAISARIAINAELALRYYYLAFTVSGNWPNGGAVGAGGEPNNLGPNISLTTLAYPTTIGVRYRFGGFEKQLNYETGKMEIITKKNDRRKHSTK
jgi:hypothetical protein